MNASSAHLFGNVAAILTAASVTGCGQIPRYTGEAPCPEPKETAYCYLHVTRTDGKDHCAEKISWRMCLDIPSWVMSKRDVASVILDEAGKLESAVAQAAGTFLDKSRTLDGLISCRAVNRGDPNPWAGDPGIYVSSSTLAKFKPNSFQPGFDAKPIWQDTVDEDVWTTRGAILSIDSGYFSRIMRDAHYSQGLAVQCDDCSGQPEIIGCVTCAAELCDDDCNTNPNCCQNNANCMCWADCVNIADEATCANPAVCGPLDSMWMSLAHCLVERCADDCGVSSANLCSESMMTGTVTCSGTAKVGENCITSTSCGCGDAACTRCGTCFMPDGSSPSSWVCQ